MKISKKKITILVGGVVLSCNMAFCQEGNLIEEVTVNKGRSMSLTEVKNMDYAKQRMIDKKNMVNDIKKCSKNNVDISKLEEENANNIDFEKQSKTAADIDKAIKDFSKNNDDQENNKIKKDNISIQSVEKRDNLADSGNKMYFESASLSAEVDLIALKDKSDLEKNKFCETYGISQTCLLFICSLEAATIKEKIEDIKNDPAYYALFTAISTQLCNDFNNMFGIKVSEQEIMEDLFIVRVLNSIFINDQHKMIDTVKHACLYRLTEKSKPLIEITTKKAEEQLISFINSSPKDRDQLYTRYKLSYVRPLRLKEEMVLNIINQLNNKGTEYFMPLILSITALEAAFKQVGIIVSKEEILQELIFLEILTGKLNEKTILKDSSFQWELMKDAQYNLFIYIRNNHESIRNNK